MSSIQSINNYTNSTNGLQSNMNPKAKKQELAKDDLAVEYYVEEKQDSEKKTYTVDMDKVRNMKAETDQRMIDLFKQSVSKSTLKQVGGLRGVLDRLLKGEEVDGVSFSYTNEDIQKAKDDIAPGGYWSPESTSDRFLEFAKALSGGDPSKAKELMEGFKKGYEQAEELWGGSLPDISKNTYDLTIKKFEKWADEQDSTK